MARPRNRREVAQTSEQKYVGWQWEGQDSLPAVLTRINMALGILKAALVQPLDPEGNDPLFGNYVIGDYMREQRGQSEEQNQEWDEYLRDKQTPPGWAEIPNAPKPRIVDVSRERNTDEQFRRPRNSTTRRG